MIVSTNMEIAPPRKNREESLMEKLLDQRSQGKFPTADEFVQLTYQELQQKYSTWFLLRPLRDAYLDLRLPLPPWLEGLNDETQVSHTSSNG